MKVQRPVLYLLLGVVLIVSALTLVYYLSVPAIPEQRTGTENATSTSTTTATTSTTITSANGASVWKYIVNGTANAVAVTPDGSYLAAGSQSSDLYGSVYLFDKDRNLLWRYDADTAIFGLAMPSNASYVAASGSQLIGPSGAYSNNKVYILSKEGKLLQRYSTGSSPVFTMFATPDGSHLIVRSTDSLLCLDSSGNLLWKQDIGESGAFTVSSNGTLIAVGGSGKVQLFTIDGNLLWDYRIQDVLVGPVAISKDGAYVAAGSVTSGTNGTVYLLDGKGNLLWKRHVDSDILSASTSYNGSYVAFGTNGWTLYYNREGTLLWNYSSPNSKVIASPTGSYVWIGLWANIGHTVLLINRTGVLAWALDTQTVHSIEVAQNARLAAVAAGPSSTGPYSGGTIYLIGLEKSFNP